jgi:hypothetical protein
MVPGIGPLLTIITAFARVGRDGRCPGCHQGNNRNGNDDLLVQAQGL